MDHLKENRQSNWEQGELCSSLRVLPESNFSIYSDKTAVEIFEFFFHDEQIQLLVDESNNYALFKNLPNPNITCEELRCFLGILIQSSYNVLPNKRLYWDVRYDGFKHYIQKIEKKRQCAGQYCKEKTSAVCTKCAKCGVGLCVECFEVFHEKQ